MPGKQKGSDAAVAAPLSGTHIQIIACAGSGKTETLARRVAHLIAAGVPPDSIVAFTFTEKAAGELKERIIQRAKEKCGKEVLGQIGRMYIGTIHAYALWLLQKYVPKFGTYDLIDEDALRAWVARYRKSVLGISQWKGLWGKVGDFLRDASIVENEVLGLRGEDSFSKNYRNFVDQLEAARLLTFGRSIAAAVEALENKQVRADVHKDVRYVFVDEYQDVNPAQEKLIRGIVGPSTQLCVVGDDDQSIYQWRGSDVANMQGFVRRYAKVLEVELDQNRRSLPSIVNVAADFAKTIRPRLVKEIKELRQQAASAHPVRVADGGNRDDEARLIATAIRGLQRSGWKLNQIAVLVRRWKQVIPILHALEQVGIDFDCGGGTSLFSTELGYLLAAGFIMAAGWGPRYGWRQQHLRQPSATSKQWSVQLQCALQLKERERKGAQRWLDNLIKSQKQKNRPASLIKDIQTLAEQIGVGAWDLSNLRRRAQFGTIARFSQVLQSFERGRLTGRWVDSGNGPEFRGASNDRGSWFYKELAHYLNGYALDAADGYAPPPDPTNPAVQITTIHSAKGLQWPIVFIPGLEQNQFPSKYIGNFETAIPSSILSARVQSRYAGSDADERRLFYVAMTRARDLAILTHADQAKTNSVLPSPYYEFVSHHKAAYRAKSGIGTPPRPDKETQTEEPVPSLTFSELASYGSCAYGYRLANEFGFAPPISRDLGYGKSVHHVLRLIGEITKKTGRVPTRAQIERLFKSEFHVPFASGPGQREMADAGRRLVNNYVSKWSDDLKKVWEVERPFELHLNSLIVVGRADVILDHSDTKVPKLTIVDYKSGQANPAAAYDQLRTYAAAARAEGYEVAGAILHNLATGNREPVSIGETDIRETIDRATSWARGISQKDFAPSPARAKCADCDFKLVCRHRFQLN